MTEALDPSAIATLLRQSGHAPGVRGTELSVLSTKGISHDHWRVGDSGLILRIPRMNQWGLDAADALAYQAAAFNRAAKSGHTPECLAVLAPEDVLPRGALLVSQVEGRAPALPHDLEAIAAALAEIHALSLPPGGEPGPLQVHRNPISSTLQIIKEQAAFLTNAEIDPDAAAGIFEELACAQDFAVEGEPDFAPCLVCTDAHPGNFMIDAKGKAWFVDLEKTLYGAAPIDLAHVTLSTSTGWDPDCRGTLLAPDVLHFYEQYLDLVGRERAAELSPWLLFMRRLTWLRTITWFVRWKAEWSANDHAAMRDTRMAAHIREHINRCLAPEAVAAARGDWLALSILAN